MCGNKYSNDKQQQQILNVGTEVFQDSENTQILIGTGNISQIHKQTLFSPYQA